MPRFIFCDVEIIDIALKELFLQLFVPAGSRNNQCGIPVGPVDRISVPPVDIALVIEKGIAAAAGDLLLQGILGLAGAGAHGHCFDIHRASEHDVILARALVAPENEKALLASAGLAHGVSCSSSFPCFS